MTHCPICGQRTCGSVFALCSQCREQIISLRPGDPRYFWYARAVRRAVFDA